jgi:outer membrane protein TolC
MKRIIFFILIITLQTGIYLPAQTVTLEQARALALANSRSLAKYNLSLRSSVLDEKSQLYSMLPSVSAGYSASMNYLDRNWGFVNPVDTFTSGLDFSITQKIFEGGKSFLQKAISGIATEGVRKEALAEYFNVLDAADNAYYAVLEAAATLEAEESSLQTALASLAIAEIRQKSGMINQGDFLKAMADREARENSRNQARRSLSLNITKLKNLIGIEKTAEMEPVNFDAYEKLIQFLAGISDEDADALYDRFWEVVAASNISLARAALNSQRAEINLSLAKRDYAPVITATVFSGGINYSAAGGFGSSSGGGVSLRGSIPIDFWVMNNRIERSKIARDSSALDYISAEVNLGTELQSVLLNILAYAGSVVHSELSLGYTEKHFEFVSERYRLLQSSISDLNEASTALINSRNNLIKSRYGFLQSLSKLRSLGAIDNEEKLIDLLAGK